MSFDVNKIDRSFLKKLNPKDLTIISATKLIAHEFAAFTVAEGIETEQELTILKTLGFKYIRGFLFSKPLPTDQVPSWLNEFSNSQSIEKA